MKASTSILAINSSTLNVNKLKEHLQWRMKSQITFSTINAIKKKLHSTQQLNSNKKIINFALVIIHKRN
jgi:hypothetical protein